MLGQSAEDDGEKEQDSQPAVQLRQEQAGEPLPSVVLLKGAAVSADTRVIQLYREPLPSDTKVHAARLRIKVLLVMQ